MLYVNDGEVEVNQYAKNWPRQTPFLLGLDDLYAQFSQFSSKGGKSLFSLLQLPKLQTKTGFSFFLSLVII